MKCLLLVTLLLTRFANSCWSSGGKGKDKTTEGEEKVVYKYRSLHKQERINAYLQRLSWATGGAMFRISFVLIILKLIQDVTPEAEESWPGVLCKRGAGTRQSPIDILTPLVTRDFHKDFIKHGRLVFKGYDDEMIPFSVFNNGHTLQFISKGVGKEAMHPTVQGGPLAKEYRLEQIHFHWPSEHAINGHKFPMEVHFVHVRGDLDPQNALKEWNGLAILAVFWNVAKVKPRRPVLRVNDYYYFVDLVIPGSRLDSVLVDAGDLLSPDRRHYFSYAGSLSSPECNEAVIWIVFEEPAVVAEETYRLFGTLGVQNNNYRSLQPLVEHQVYRTPIPNLLTPLIQDTFSEFTRMVKQEIRNITSAVWDWSGRVAKAAHYTFYEFDPSKKKKVPGKRVLPKRLDVAKNTAISNKRIYEDIFKGDGKNEPKRMGEDEPEEDVKYKSKLIGEDVSEEDEKNVMDEDEEDQIIHKTDDLSKSQSEEKDKDESQPRAESESKEAGEAEVTEKETHKTQDKKDEGKKGDKKENIDKTKSEGKINDKSNEENDNNSQVESKYLYQIKEKDKGETDGKNKGESDENAKIKSEENYDDNTQKQDKKYVKDEEKEDEKEDKVMDKTVDANKGQSERKIKDEPVEENKGESEENVKVKYKKIGEDNAQEEDKKHVKDEYKQDVKVEDKVMDKTEDMNKGQSEGEEDKGESEENVKVKYKKIGEDNTQEEDKKHVKDEDKQDVKVEDEVMDKTEYINKGQSEGKDKDEPDAEDKGESEEKVVVKYKTIDENAQEADKKHVEDDDKQDVKEEDKVMTEVKTEDIDESQPKDGGKSDEAGKADDIEQQADKSQDVDQDQPERKNKNEPEEKDKDESEENVNVKSKELGEDNTQEEVENGGTIEDTDTDTAGEHKGESKEGVKGKSYGNIKNKPDVIDKAESQENDKGLTESGADNQSQDDNSEENEESINNYDNNEIVYGGDDNEAIQDYQDKNKEENKDIIKTEDKDVTKEEDKVSFKEESTDNVKKVKDENKAIKEYQNNGEDEEKDILKMEDEDNVKEDKDNDKYDIDGDKHIKEEYTSKDKDGRGVNAIINKVLREYKGRQFHPRKGMYKSYFDSFKEN